MSTPTTQEPPVETPAAEPVTPPVETPAVETPAPVAEPADITNLALSRLGYALEDELPAEAPVEPAETPAEGEAPAAETPTPAEGEAAAPAPASEEAPAEVRKVKKKVAAPAPAPAPPTAKDIIDGVTAAMRATTTPAAPAAVTPDDPAAALTDFDREEYELARFAEEAMPEKYKGHAAKVIAFAKARDEKIRTIIEKEGEFDANSEEYTEFVRKAKPAFQGADRNRLMREQIERNAAAKAEAKFAEREQRLERKLRAIESTPVIERTVNTVAEQVLAVEDEAVKEFKADPAKAVESNPVEAPIIESVLKDVRDLTSEYLKIAHELTDPDPKNPIHVGLSTFVREQGKRIDALPVEQRTRQDGRVYISRERMIALRRAKDPSVENYCELSDNQVVDLIRDLGKTALTTRLTDARTRLEKAGFKRTPVAAAPVGAAPAAVPPKPAVVRPAAPKSVAPPSAARPATPASKSTSAPHLKSMGFSDPDA